MCRYSSPSEHASAWLRRFEDALLARDVEAVTGLFAPDCYWRDLVAFTWNIKTMEGRDAIGHMVAATLDNVQPSGWTLVGEASESDGVIEAQITFETAVARGSGHIKLGEEGCWTLSTAAQALKGHEERRGPFRSAGAPYGARRGGAVQDGRSEAEPYVVVVGGSQAGIALGARLAALGMPHVVLESSARAGDKWRTRYDALSLHDPVWCTHLPYMQFPETWPVYPSKDQVADWLEMYVKVMGVNYWTNARCTAATWDSAAREWAVTVERDGETVRLAPKQFVLATGLYGLPSMPTFEGEQEFRQDREVIHSSSFVSGAAYAGKRVVVVGCGTSAHDICADLHSHGACATMVQRSSTTIVGRKTLCDVLCGDLYSEAAVEKGIDPEKADLIFASIPYRPLAEAQRVACAKMQELDAGILDRLRQRGFLIDFGEDGTGNFMKFVRAGKGYYFDCGASELIASGEVGLKVGQIARLSGQGVVMEDGAVLPADAVILATGYGPINDLAAQFLGREVTTRLGKVWGLGSGTPGDPGPWEGELRNMWKPTQVEGLWVHGGNLQMNRSYSLYLALQLQARALGLQTQVYGLQEVHHAA